MKIFVGSRRVNLETLFEVFLWGVLVNGKRIFMRIIFSMCGYYFLRGERKEILKKIIYLFK